MNRLAGKSTESTKKMFSKKIWKKTVIFSLKSFFKSPIMIDFVPLCKINKAHLGIREKTAFFLL
jgi:hypothetical protein